MVSKKKGFRTHGHTDGRSVLPGPYRHTPGDKKCILMLSLLIYTTHFWCSQGCHHERKISLTIAYIGVSLNINTFQPDVNYLVHTFL